MENAFDFYYVEVTGKIRDMIKAGIERSSIHTQKVGFKSYGRKSFPVYENIATVWSSGIFQNINPDIASQQAEEIKNQYKAKGFKAYVKYHYSD